MSDIIPLDTPQDKPTPKTTFIYVLIDPETDQVRYVGKSDNPNRRFRGHIAEKRTYHKSHWVQDLKKRGLTPILQVIEEVPYEEWESRECFWIEHYRNHGASLTNIAVGGKAGLTTPEIREKMGAAKRGKTLSPEHKKKIGDTQRGKKQPPDAIAKSAAARRGQKLSLESRANMSAARRNLSPEARANISAAQRGLKHAPHSEEHRRKIGESHRGMKRSPEAKARMSLAARKRWQSMKVAPPPDIPTLWD